MKGASRKLISLTLAVLMLFSLLSLTACNRRYDEEEVLAAAKDLLKRAEMLNEVYYGSGIKYFDSEDKVGLYYCKADKMHLGELGFSTIEELKKITEQTFSAIPPQVPTRIKVFVPQRKSSSTAIAALGPPIPVEQTETGTPRSFPV